MQRLRTVLALTVVATGLATAGGIDSASAACTASSKASFAKVQIWAEPGCAGGSLIIPMAGDDDRPDFAQFANYDGKVYNVDNTRSSVSLAAGWCVKLFDAPNYGGVESFVYCGGSVTAHYNLSSFDNRASSMRTCPTGARTQCNKVAPAPAPSPSGTPPPPVEEDPIAEPTTGTGEGVVEPDAPPDLGADPVAGPGPDDQVAGGANDLGALGPNDGLRFDRAGRRCSGGSTQGARALRIWLQETAIAQRRQAGIYQCAKRRRGRRSDLHGEGRAVDFQPASRSAAEQLVALLLADNYALVRRMGIQEIIYNGRVWSAAQPSPVLRRYRGASPHRRSVHIGLNRKGARMQTSFWVGR